MKELPLIACSLPASSQGARLDEWHALVDAATTRARTGVGAILRFGPADAARARALAAAEKECCPFFSFEFLEEGDETTMLIRAPLQAAELIDRLLA
jgi:MerR family copper efflux transcriptional regulator